MKISTEAIAEIEDEALRHEVLAVFSILGSGVYSKNFIKKYVRRLRRDEIRIDSGVDPRG